MPSVPRYQQQVNQAAISNVRVNTDTPDAAFGGGEVIAAPTRALQQTATIVQEEIAKANQVAVTDADAKIAEAKNRLMWDPNDGLITKKGKNAFGAKEEFNTKYKEAIAKIAGELSNPAQRGAFEARAREHEADLNDQINKHVFKESEVYEGEVVQSSLQVYHDDAVMNYTDPDKVAKSIEEQKKVLVEHAQRQGKGPEWLADKLTDVESKTKSGIIERMLSNDEDIAAEKYFTENKGKFTAQDAVRLEKVVAESSLRGGSQRQVDALISKGVSMTAGLEEIKKIENPKLRDATQERFRNEMNYRKAAQEEGLRQVYESLGSKIEKSKGDLTEVEKSRGWQVLEVSQKENLMRWAANLRENKLTPTDPQTYNMLSALSSTPETQEQFLKTNILDYINKLSPGDRNKFIDLQASIRKGDGSKTAEVRSRQQIISQTAAIAGIDPKDDQEEFFKLNRAVDEQIQVMESNGQKVGPKEYQAIVDNLVAPVTTSDSGFKIPFTDARILKSKKKLYTVETGEQVMVLDPKDVPRGERLAIEQSLKKAGIQPTEEKITKLYEARLNKRGG